MLASWPSRAALGAKERHRSIKMAESCMPPEQMAVLDKRGECITVWDVARGGPNATVPMRMGGDGSRSSHTATRTCCGAPGPTKVSRLGRLSGPVARLCSSSALGLQAVDTSLQPLSTK